MEKKLILFGAGQIGKKALNYFGRENVSYFADNNESMAGKYLNGVRVISFARLLEIHAEYEIILSMDVGASLVVSAQLEDAGISDYQTFFEILNRASQDRAIQTQRQISEVGQKHLSKEEKQVLIIAYQFPPLSGSGVFRSIKFAKYLPTYGWWPTVISTDRPRPGWNYSDESMVKEIPDHVTVIRISDVLNTSCRPPTERRRLELVSFLREAMPENEETHSLISEWESTKTGQAELLTFPCACLAWAYDVVRYIEEVLDISQFQAVYTTSDPYSAHVAGAYLKKKYGIAWVADYRDPWTADPTKKKDYARPRDQLLLYLEGNLLHLADKSIAIEEHMAVDYIERFHAPEEKISVITNGYDEEDYEDNLAEEKQKDKFTINYSGILHVGRSIDTVLIAIQKLWNEHKLNLSHIQLRIVGEARQYDPCQVAMEYGLESIIKQTGYLSHREALQSNYDSNILLLLVGDSEEVKFAYTVKFFDYLRCGRPILAIAPAVGVVDEVLQETGHGKAFLSTQISEIKEMILDEYLKWRQGEDREQLHSPLIERFERKRLTGQLAEILDSVSRKSAK